MKKFSLTTKANSRRASRNKTFARFGIAAFGLLILVVILPGLFTTLAGLVISPVHGVREWITTSTDSLPQYLRDRDTLIKKIKDLEAEIATNQTSSLTIRRLQNENTNFRQLLNAEVDERILASVVARPNRLPYDVIQLDQGSEDGVVLDAPIFLGLDQVVGHITHVMPNYSFATLVSTPGFSSTVYIVGPNIYTPAEGIGGGILRVRVPQGIDLSLGDMVVLPAIESGIYGEIVSLETVPTRPEQYGYVSTGVPLQGLRFVTVGTEPLTEQTFDAAKEHIETVKENYFTVPVPAGVLVEPETATGTVATSTATTTEL